MKILLFLSLLLLITIIHPASYKDNQTDIYVKEYTGEIIKSGDVSYQASRLVIGVKEGVTKDEVAEIAKSVGGEISGWSIVPSLYDSYSIDLPKDKLEFALFALKTNIKLIYAIRNFNFNESNFNYTEFPVHMVSNPYLGELIQTKSGTYYQANRLLLTVKENITKTQVRDLISPYDGVISGWIRNKDKEPDWYTIDLPSDKQTLAFKELSKKEEVEDITLNLSISENDSVNNANNIICGISIFAMLVVIFSMLLVLKKKR